MTGESNLVSLLRKMEPVIVPGEYVFCSIKESQLVGLEKPMMVYREKEGATVIITKDVAENNGFAFDSTWGLVSLSIHSDLEAVGLLAVITNHLAKVGISVNVVSAFYHDHLFVPFGREEEVVSLLSKLSNSRQR
ncbi:MAG: ACT domain-containing protein [Promethearchaeota archaeon]